MALDPVSFFAGASALGGAAVSAVWNRFWGWRDEGAKRRIAEEDRHRAQRDELHARMRVQAADDSAALRLAGVEFFVAMNEYVAARTEVPQDPPTIDVLKFAATYDRMAATLGVLQLLLDDELAEATGALYNSAIALPYGDLGAFREDPKNAEEVVVAFAAYKSERRAFMTSVRGLIAEKKRAAVS